jgi:AcrR family transcriptional regulator
MRDLKVPESGPKRNLLDATERLVVEKGFDLVSVRDITGAIKANVAAVNYHFGSREGLMDLVMSHVMDAVDAARVEALENAARLESRGPVEEIVAAYVNSVLTAAGRVEMDLAFFLKLSGRVMVFPAALMSPALAEGRKQMNVLYLKALAGAVPQMTTVDLEASWAFFEAGLGQSLVNLRSDLAPSVQAGHWIRFGVSALGVSGISQKEDPIVPADQTDPTDLPEKVEQPAEAVVPETAEIPKPAKAPKAKPKKADDQSMMFDF